MKIYIAGRIDGDPEYERKFAEFSALFENEGGHVVLNPAVLPKGLSVAEYMRICFAMIDVADCVMFLPDWESSGGAQLEKAYCDYIGKPYQIYKEEKNND